VLAEHQDEPLVALVLEGLHLPAQLLGRQGPPDRGGVAALEAAVAAVVDAAVAHVERGEEDDAVAVDRLLQPPGGVEDLLHQGRVVGEEQRCRLLDRERLLGEALGHEVPHPRGVRPRAGEEPPEDALVDEVGAALAEPHGR
jgi:hypothetical protein